MKRDKTSRAKAAQKLGKKRERSLVLRILICILAAGVTILAYIEKQNELTELRVAIPSIAKEVKVLQEENTRLKYEVDQFESPIHLMELMSKPEFSHLKFPYLNEEVFLPKSSSPYHLRSSGREG